MYGEIIVEERIRNKLKKMSKGQKKISVYVTQNYDKAAFMTAAELGKTVGVSESTVVRFASFIGYSGYPEFQKELSGMVRKKLDRIDRIDIDNENMPGADVINSVMCSDINKLKMTLEMLDTNIFDEAIESILSAECIYIVGIRNCLPLAELMGFYFNLMFDNVRIISTSNSTEIYEQIMRINKNDVMLGISFPRYSKTTLKAMEFANDRSAKVIAITDNVNSPMNLYSSCNLFAKSELTSMMDSITAPVSLINAIVVALSIKKQDKVKENMEMLKKIREDYQSYEGDEMDIFDDTIDIHTK